MWAEARRTVERPRSPAARRPRSRGGPAPANRQPGRRAAGRLRQIEQQAAEIAASRARIVEAQDEERRRLERDLHDGVQQDLASLIGKLRLAINQIAMAPDDAATTIGGAQDDVRRTLADVRAIAQGIHPAILDDQGIVRAIDGPGQAAPARGFGARPMRSWPPGASIGRSRAPPTSSRPRRSPTSSSTPRRRLSPFTWRSTAADW